MKKLYFSRKKHSTKKKRRLLGGTNVDARTIQRFTRGKLTRKTRTKNARIMKALESSFENITHKNLPNDILQKILRETHEETPDEKNNIDHIINNWGADKSDVYKFFEKFMNENIHNSDIVRQRKLKKINYYLTKKLITALKDQRDELDELDELDERDENYDNYIVLLFGKSSNKILEKKEWYEILNLLSVMNEEINSIGKWPTEKINNYHLTKLEKVVKIFNSSVYYEDIDNDNLSDFLDMFFEQLDKIEQAKFNL